MEYWLLQVATAIDWAHHLLDHFGIYAYFRFCTRMGAMHESHQNFLRDFNALKLPMTSFLNGGNDHLRYAIDLDPERPAKKAKL